MAKVTVEVCDVCHDRERPVQIWRVAGPGARMRRVALCEEHAMPLLRLVGKPVHRRGVREVLDRDDVP